MNEKLFQHIIDEFSNNKIIFSSELNNAEKDLILWREKNDKWCLLEIVCHLYDEEREDFRTRFFSVLKDPETPFPTADPVGWVTERKYIDQDFNNKLTDFINERENSIKMLTELRSPNWKNTYQHPKIGPMSTKMILSNWLAHDYLHLRQILRIKFMYLKQNSSEALDYAGEW